MAVVKFSNMSYDAAGDVIISFFVHSVPVQHLNAALAVLADCGLTDDGIWDICEHKAYGSATVKTEAGTDPEWWADELNTTLNEALGEA